MMGIMGGGGSGGRGGGRVGKAWGRPAGNVGVDRDAGSSRDEGECPYAGKSTRTSFSSCGHAEAIIRRSSSSSVNFHFTVISNACRLLKRKRGRSMSETLTRLPSE